MGFFRSPTGDRRGRSSSMTSKTLEMLPRTVANYREMKNEDELPVVETESSSNTEPATSGSSSEDSNSNRGNGRSDHDHGRSSMSVASRGAHSTNHHCDSDGRRGKDSSSVSRRRSSRSGRSNKSSKSSRRASHRSVQGMDANNGRDEECDALASDMTVLADGLHLDSNTKTLLAAYDATTVENFFLMGENDFSHLIARARASNRSLPPLQIRKIRILREWVGDLVAESDPSKLPAWAQSDAINNHRSGRGAGGQSLIPRDWQKRYLRDLPMLKKRVRERGDSFTEVFPWLSYFFTIREAIAGACGACGSR